MIWFQNTVSQKSNEIIAKTHDHDKQETFNAWRISENEQQMNKLIHFRIRTIVQLNFNSVPNPYDSSTQFQFCSQSVR